ncbi:MAG TPA: response regulator [Puia sp.]|nr:response regulator [Puia sp.]
MLPYILLAEDDPDDRSSFVTDFERHIVFAAVETVGDGQQLIDFLSRCRWDRLPSMILIDYKIPCLNAPEILRQLSADPRYSNIPKYVWSAALGMEEIDQCKQLGASTYFEKPSGPREMEEIVHQLGELLNAELSVD